MLSPVSTASNSSLNLQDMRSQGETNAGQTAAGQASIAVARSGLDQNMTIAGRINMLLLSGPERMSQNLAILVDVLGRALKLDRQPEESLSAYAARLLTAMEGLDPQQRSNLQKLLYQSFAGLQLRTLLEAFRNPAGPEAATLSVYLELYRQKEKDLAARSVVGSYQQNDGEKPANDAPRLSQGTAQQPSTSRETSGAARSANAMATGGGANPAGFAPVKASSQPGMATVTAGQSVGVSSGLDAAEIGVVRTSLSQSPVPAAGLATVPADGPDIRPIPSAAHAISDVSQTVASRTENPKANETPIRSSISGRDDPVPAIRKPDTDNAVRGEALRQRQAEDASSKNETMREVARISAEGLARSASGRGDAVPGVTSFRQWSEAMRLAVPVAGNGGAEKGTNTLLASLLTMVVPGPAAEPQAPVQQRPEALSRDRAMAEAIRREMADLQPDRDGETNSATAKPGGFEEKVMVALTAQGQEAAQMRLPQSLPGQAIPFVNYLFVDDEPDADQADDEQDRAADDNQERSAGDDEEAASPHEGEEGRDEIEEATPLPVGSSLSMDTESEAGLHAAAEDRATRLLAPPATDGAAGLYFRMIDWA